MNFPNKFVCEDISYSTYEKNVPNPIFRKSFNANKVDTAELLICGLGFYDLFINGKKITKGYLAPYITNSDWYTYFDKYDIVPYLTDGENVIGVMLGDGFQNNKTCVWNFKDYITNSAPQLALSCEIKSGDDVISFTAEDFKCKKGPILFSDTRSGVFYDARLWENGWNMPGYDDSDWHAPIEGVRPRGEAKLCEIEPIKVYREIKPVSFGKGEIQPYERSWQVEDFCQSFEPFEKPSDYTGGYIYDFGENNSGIYRLKIKGEKGQKISIQCAEQLTDGKLNYSNIDFYPDGFSQRDIYYLSGEGEEVFEPMFTFHGYRYIYVTGVTEEQATEDLLTYLVMSSDLENRGSFECSDDIVNTLYQMGRRSDISNFFYFPMDCPHREKNGWTGDAAASAEHMIMTIGAEKSWREWLTNIRAAMTEDGKLPGIVPTVSWGYEWGNGPAWDTVIFTLPYFIYKFRGNTEIIKENATVMLRYLDYISRKRDDRGLVGIGLGDWVPTGTTEADAYDADLFFTDSVMVLDMCRKAEVMFDAVGLTLHKAFAVSLGKEMLQAIRKEFIDFDTFIVKNKCQSSQAMAIYYNVFDEDEKEKAFSVLMDIIKEDNYSFTSGFLGLRVIFHVLSEFGEAETAYNMITKKEFPSYRWWIDKGETTFLEQFYEYDNYYQQSKNHHFLGDIINWFMSSLAGLKVQNHKSVVIKPCFVRQLNWCKAEHTLPSGKVMVSWKKENGIAEVLVSAPDGVDLAVDFGKHVFEKKDKNTYIVKL
ncbi:MAG: family 78 glycoside hydrolase catalytic domain [Clostridia bacterium]|nr:family 78 glycoside hydrolase catalytic domain [Clostridia bacterium]